VASDCFLIAYLSSAGWIPDWWSQIAPMRVAKVLGAISLFSACVTFFDHGARSLATVAAQKQADIASTFMFGTTLIGGTTALVTFIAILLPSPRWLDWEPQIFIVTTCIPSAKVGL
jgi:hypothetical protein